MLTGLFFGSFNPVHIGHMAIANYIVEFTDLQEIWFVVSPQNPLKEKSALLEDYHRLELLNLAIGDYPKFKSSNIEFSMPKPSYTIDTLMYLGEKFPKRKFSIIMGADNLHTFKKWKNFEQILSNYTLFVYPRPGFDGGDLKSHKSVVWVDAPTMLISSSFLRDCIAKGKDLRYFMPEAAYKYLKNMNFYSR